MKCEALRYLEKETYFYTLTELNVVATKQFVNFGALL